MCIRDRGYVLAVATQIIVFPWFSLHPSIGQSLALGGVFIAVSYTHLRAHETVLDIVCRLLLEKKKKEKKYKTKKK